MITIDSAYLSGVSKPHRVLLEHAFKKKRLLKKYHKAIDSRDQGFYKVIDDPSIAKDCMKFAVKKGTGITHVVVLGIGGSSLGTICIQKALTHLFETERKRKILPTLHVIDNIDPYVIRDLEDVITLSSTQFIVVTKSGETPETMALYMYFRKRLEDSGLKAKDHMVFITDPKKGLLRKVAKQDGIATFDVPTRVGGRFSALTPVSMLPLAFVGVDIEQLIAGAKDMRASFLHAEPSENLPFQLAFLQYHMYKKGKTQHVLWPYANKLVGFGEWYRQLLSESIGKTLDRKGKIVHVGITPITALGATDQHSQSQLYNEGPNDKFFMFMEVDDMGPEVSLPVLHHERSLKFLQGVHFEELLKTEKLGSQLSLVERDRPHISINISALDAYHMGALMMLFEASTAFLGEFFGIDAFNQPGVERSKQLTKDMLLHAL